MNWPGSARSRYSSAEMSTEQQSSLASMLFPKDRLSLTVQEVAAKLLVDKQHVINLIDRGHLEAVKVGGKVTQWRIPVFAYEQFLLTRSSKRRSRKQSNA